jgi:hypothetical protein
MGGDVADYDVVVPGSGLAGDCAALEAAAAAKRASQPKSTRTFKKVMIPWMTWEDWVEPVINEMVAAGRVMAAGSAGDLARTIGVLADGLTGTLNKYNADVAASEGTVHLKKPGVLRPVATPPFYATEVRLCQLSVTAVGPRIDRDSASSLVFGRVAGRSAAHAARAVAAR